MLAVTKTKPEPGVDVIEASTPKIASRSEVLIKVATAAICGGDLKIYRWDPTAMKRWSRLNTFEFPRVLGHEISGTVVEVGRDVSDLAVGDRVAVESHVPCGQCRACRSGRMHLCCDDRLVGVGLDGGFAKYAVVPSFVAVRIPEAISFERAALLEPLGVALHAVEVSGLIVGDKVGVLGCGPIGLYVALLARAGGASRVVMTDLSSYRAQLARSLGFETVLNEGDDNGAIDHMIRSLGGQLPRVVFDAAGAPGTVCQSLQLAQTSGRVVLIGTFRGRSMADTSKHIVHREVTMTGISGRRIFATWERLFNIVCSDIVDPVSIVTHRFPLSEAVSAFDLAARSQTGKVLLLPPER